MIWKFEVRVLDKFGVVLLVRVRAVGGSSPMASVRLENFTKGDVIV